MLELFKFSYRCYFSFCKEISRISCGQWGLKKYLLHFKMFISFEEKATSPKFVTIEVDQHLHSNFPIHMIRTPDTGIPIPSTKRACSFLKSITTFSSWRTRPYRFAIFSLVIAKRARDARKKRRYYPRGHLGKGGGGGGAAPALRISWKKGVFFQTSACPRLL